MAEGTNNRCERLMNIWLEGALRASTSILATKARLFTCAMSNVAADIFIQTAKEQYGLEMEEAHTMAQAVENYMVAEVQNGLATDVSLFIKEKDARTLEVTVTDCPYGLACGNFVKALQGTGELSKDDIPCLRADCYGVAVTRMTGGECSYRLLQFSPGIRCQARLEVA